MSRHPFGGDAAVVDVQGNVLVGVTGTVWTAETAGTQIVDLLKMDGSAITSVLTDANGKYAFQGPNSGLDQVWIDFGRGRWLCTARDIPTRVKSLETGTVPVTDVGAAGGVAPLDESQQLPVANLPADTAGDIAQLQAQMTDVLTRLTALEDVRLYADTVPPAQPGNPGDKVWLDMT